MEPSKSVARGYTMPGELKKEVDLREEIKKRVVMEILPEDR